MEKYFRGETYLHYANDKRSPKLEHSDMPIYHGIGRKEIIRSLENRKQVLCKGGN